MYIFAPISGTVMFIAKAFKVYKRKTVYAKLNKKKEILMSTHINIRFEMYGMLLFKREHETQSFHLAI